MREDGAGSGDPRQVQSVSRAWWRTRWFYLLSQGGIGILLIPLFGAFVYPNLPYLIMLLALSSGLLVPFALFPRLRANPDKKTIALRERERTVREDLKGNKTLLASVGEALAPFFPQYLETTWRILFFRAPQGPYLRRVATGAGRKRAANQARAFVPAG